MYYGQLLLIHKHELQYQRGLHANVPLLGKSISMNCTVSIYSIKKERRIIKIITKNAFHFSFWMSQFTFYPAYSSINSWLASLNRTVGLLQLSSTSINVNCDRLNLKEKSGAKITGAVILSVPLRFDKKKNSIVNREFRKVSQWSYFIDGNAESLHPPLLKLANALCILINC